MDATFDDRSLVVGDSLVVADLHLGRAERAAVDLPRDDGRDVLERLERLLAAHEPETLLLAGDVLHAFDSVPHGVPEAVAALEETAVEAGCETVAVRGNHDTMLDGLWDGTVVESHRLDSRTAVVHGHEPPSVDADRYVLGHDHPVIEIEGQRRPCWLVGPGGPSGTEIVVLPAFSRFPSGVVINWMRASAFQSPLVEDTDALAPVVWNEAEGRPLRFPPLGKFRHRL